MPTEFWSKKQDPQCAAQIKELEQKLEALGKVVEELSIESGKLHEEFLRRSQVADNAISEAESRLIFRIEELEERLSRGGDYSQDEAKTGTDAAGGYRPWSERKRSAAAKESDPNVWKPKAKPEPAPKAEEK